MKWDWNYHPNPEPAKDSGNILLLTYKKKFFFNFVERQKNINTLSLILLQRT